MTKLKKMPNKNVSQTVLNNILKGLLFAQEMHVHTSMDFFFKQNQEKYNFLFNRGSNRDEIIFQGSSAEGLTILRIEEISNVKSAASYAQLKWKRCFDFDVLCVQNHEVIDVLTNGSDIYRECRHFDEPLLMMRWGDWTGVKKKLILEHVILVRPCCESCMTPKEVYKGVTVRHEPMVWTDGVSNRLVEVFMPLEFYSKFCEEVKENPHPGEKCNVEWNNKFGDLCEDCRTANRVTIHHDGQARTDIFMDTIGQYL